MKQTLQLILDRLAIATSLICAIHCIAMPILLGLSFSWLPLFLQDERFHQLMVWLIIPSSIIALFIGYRAHKDSKVLMGILSGLTIIFLTALFGHDLLGGAGEKLMTIVGAILLSISHFRNYKLRKKTCC